MRSTVRHRVGIVEDCDEDFWVFKRVAGTSCEVERWNSGELALKAFQNGAMRDMVLLFVDCHLPGLDGIDLVTRIRALENGAPLKIVMISASRSEGVAGRAMRAGVDRFERKGTGLGDLRNAVARAFALVETSTSSPDTAP